MSLSVQKMMKMIELMDGHSMMDLESKMEGTKIRLMCLWLGKMIPRVLSS